MEKEINLLWMYPDMLNLHGDRGNILAFQKIAEKMKINFNIHKLTLLTDKIDFEKADIIFFSPGELKVAEKIAINLLPKKENIEKYIEEGNYIICIGSSVAIFAKNIIKSNGQETKGIGILNVNCEQRSQILGDDLYFKINNEQEIIGTQIQTIDINSIEELGNVIYGYGNNGLSKEGVRKRNFIHTNALGPVFVKNPWWAEQILLNIANKKGIETTPIPITEYELEIQSFNSVKKFIDEKIK